MIELYVLFFLVGLAIGRVPLIYEWLKIRKENTELKEDVTVLKDHLVNTKRGKVLKRTELKE